MERKAVTTAVCVQAVFLKWVDVYCTTKSMAPRARNLLSGEQQCLGGKLLSLVVLYLVHQQQCSVGFASTQPLPDF